VAHAHEGQHGWLGTKVIFVHGAAAHYNLLACAIQHDMSISWDADCERLWAMEAAFAARL
jgi:hypothetical protein